MKAYAGVQVQLHAFLTSALDGKLHVPAALLPVPTECETEWASEPVWTR